jgi:hypothetical protein
LLFAKLLLTPFCRHPTGFCDWRAAPFDGLISVNAGYNIACDLDFLRCWNEE